MMRTCVRLGVLALLVGMGLSCTNTDTIGSGSSNVMLRVPLVNTATRFDFALFTLARIDVVPLDPQALAALGTDVIGALPPSAAQMIDFSQTIDPIQTEFSLGAGAYRITSVQIGALTFFDEDFAGAETNCQDQNLYEINGIANLRNLGPEFQFTVDPGNLSTLTLQFDGQAFATALADASTPAAGGGCTVNTTVLANLAASFLSLQ